jgi:hypothetical protein
MLNFSLDRIAGFGKNRLTSDLSTLHSRFLFAFHLLPLLFAISSAVEFQFQYLLLLTLGTDVPRTNTDLS